MKEGARCAYVAKEAVYAVEVVRRDPLNRTVFLCKGAVAQISLLKLHSCRFPDKIWKVKY